MQKFLDKIVNYDKINWKYHMAVTKRVGAEHLREGSFAERSYVNHRQPLPSHPGLTGA